MHRAAAFAALAATLVASAACSSGSSGSQASPSADPGHTATTLSSAQSPDRALMASLLERLDCDATDAGDYEAVENEEGRGVDCWTVEGQLRIHVYASEDEMLNPIPGLGINIEELPPGSEDWGRNPGVRGPNWVVVADTRLAALRAQLRLGGELVRAGPPTSYEFPSAIPDDARRRAEATSS